MARACPAGTPPSWTYSRREPEKTPLYRVFQQHLPTFERVWTDTEDGVYHPGPEGEAPVFQTAPKPTQEDIEGVVRQAIPR